MSAAVGPGYAGNLGQHQPAVDGRKPEVDDHRVEGLPFELGERGLAIGNNDLFDAVGVVEPRLHEQDARHDGLPPP